MPCPRSKRSPLCSTKNNLLESEVEKLETSIKDAKKAADEGQQHGTQNETLQRRLQLLEEEAEDADKTPPRGQREAPTDRRQGRPLRAQVQALEQERDQWEQKYEEMAKKHAALQKDLDDLQERLVPSKRVHTDFIDILLSLHACRRTDLRTQKRTGLCLSGKNTLPYLRVFIQHWLLKPISRHGYGLDCDCGISILVNILLFVIDYVQVWSIWEPSPSILFIIL
ncbi:unnamed protein product [Clonostachys rosea f. rosea IK726]|uniref:Uncharacterized protein n=1 Tax=Clonostachys rosea f. rosea IK726 TaxID=1349383 RepID=A0ACA9UVZ2_BIOOC|nr:unnamed protein product [Clonostachys rosea f. rosea IK726]